MNVLIDEELEEISFENLCQLLQDISDQRSFLINFKTTKSFETFIYWKTGGRQTFFELKLEAEKDVQDFLGNFLANSLNKGHNCELNYKI